MSDDLSREEKTKPLKYDEATANQVEKKPAKPESPQQEHDDEDQG